MSLTADIPVPQCCPMRLATLAALAASEVRLATLSPDPPLEYSSGNLVEPDPRGRQTKHFAHMAHRCPLCWHPSPVQKPKERTLIRPAKAPFNRATSSRNAGRNHLGTPSDIKSEWWATSSRIRGRLPPESAPRRREVRTRVVVSPVITLRQVAFAVEYFDTVHNSTVASALD